MDFKKTLQSDHFFTRFSGPMRSILLGTIVTVVFVQMTFSPSSLEISEGGTQPQLAKTDILRQLKESAPKLAPGIPQSKVPDYTIDGFNYISAQAGVQQWKLIAKKARFYMKDNMVYATEIIATIYDTPESTTVIVGKEARYRMDDRNLEIYGDVDTQFADGFQLKGDYLQYYPTTRTIYIPTRYFVRGIGPYQGGQRIHFTSQGIRFDMQNNQIRLLKDVDFRFEKQPPSEEYTRVVSDYCDVDRAQSLAKYRMLESRPLSERFVEVTQKGLYVRGRTVDMNYSGQDTPLEYMVAKTDVFFQETEGVQMDHDEPVLEAGNPAVVRYGTCDHAHFHAKKNIIRLSEFPQVYQNNDTVTGDVIIINRNTDIVEVKHSNAFSQGQ